MTSYRKDNRTRIARAMVWCEPVSAQQIYARDGRRCHLCGCDVIVGSAAPNGATLDHVVPLNLGGAHAVWNIATACRTCNTAKGSRADLVDLVTLLRIITTNVPKKKRPPRPKKQPRFRRVTYCVIDVKGICRSTCRQPIDCEGYARTEPTRSVL